MRMLGGGCKKQMSRRGNATEKRMRAQNRTIGKTLRRSRTLEQNQMKTTTRNLRRRRKRRGPSRVLRRMLNWPGNSHQKSTHGRVGARQTAHLQHPGNVG